MSCQNWYGRLALVFTFLAAPLFGQADLTVTAVDGSALVYDAQALTVSGAVSASIQNIGDQPSGVFSLIFFEDIDGDGAFASGVDRLLATTAQNSLGGGSSDTAMALISDTVLFRQSLIYAEVDSGDVVAESDETNNLRHSGEDCIFTPVAGPLNPQLEWSWESSMTAPGALNVMMTPGVMDLDGDGISEIIFGSTASTGGGTVEVGVLRALRGSDGVELFTVTNSAHLVNTASSVAVGDIDGDLLPEIIACSSSNNRLIAFENDGTFKWLSDVIAPVSWGAPSIADLDGDGSPEIVVGRQALSAAGTLLWTGTGGIGGQSNFPLSVVADVNLDGSPEVVAGNTLYSSTGATLWQMPLLDGYTAVANFDRTPTPEIVLVASGQVRLLDAAGTVIWGPVAIPGGGIGGPPTVADFDGDGMPEIGVAGATRYAVFETDGTLKWQSVTQDSSSNRTGSSVFDFNGDGAAEVVYRDELNLRIYEGTTGMTVFQVPLSSCTWHEYVLVADVDADGNAEIVAVANNNCGFGPQRGVFVYGDPLDNWVATRQIWNQHSYHITNVNDDGTIPAVEANNWQTPAGAPYNNYRQNILTSAPSALAAPDLTASFIQLGCAAQPSVTVRVGNAGAVQEGAGIPVSFYDGDPQAGGLLLGSSLTANFIAPGRFEDVTLNLAPGFTTTNDIFAVVDDAGGGVGTANECDEGNNTHSRAFEACDVAAAAIPYGTGWPGTLGVPGLSASAPPVLGTNIDILIGNSRGSATDVCLMAGLASQSLPTILGGTILVVPTTEPLLYIPAGTFAYGVSVPCNVDLCGVSVFVQGLEYDPGASQGYSFTAGLELRLGN